MRWAALQLVLACHWQRVSALTRKQIQAEFTKAHAQLIPDLAALARSMVRDLDPTVRPMPCCQLISCPPSLAVLGAVTQCTLSG